jgi:plastocyanin
MKRFVIAVSLSVLILFSLGMTMYFDAAGSQQHHASVTPAEAENGSPIASATVSFGGWMTNPPMDRFPNNANTQFPRLQNHHRLTPEVAKIKAGGTVNFIIGGFHVVTVYDDGTEPEDIDTTLIQLPANGGPPIINDPDRRIYRGLDPSLLPPTAAQDRVEVVHFDRPGIYLVICSVLPHFQEGMYGYVRVVPAKIRDEDVQ